MLELSAIGAVVGAVLLLAAMRFYLQKRKVVARSIVLGLVLASAVGIAISGGLLATGLADKQAAMALYLWISTFGAAAGAWRGHTIERQLGLCPSQRGKAGCSIATAHSGSEPTHERS